MGDKWQDTLLGALGGFRNGINFNRDQEGLGLAVLKVKDFEDRFFAPDSGYDELDSEAIRISDAQLLQEGDTVIIRSNGNSALVGRSVYVRKFARPVAFSGFCIRFRPDRSKIDPRFAAYLIRSPFFRQRFSAFGSGTGIQNLSQDILGSVPVRLPSIPEQRAIAHILGTFDDKIELNRRMNETLEATARALFKSWFVDFDPVYAQTTGGDPGLPKSLAKFFPARFVAAESGDVPEGWEVKLIGDLAEVVGGSTPRTSEATYWTGGVHSWVTPKDLSDLAVPVLLETERRITEAGLAQISSGLLPVGTVLLSSRAPIGYLAVAEVPVAINQGFIAMKPRKGVSNLFILFWARSAHEEVLRRANGSTFLEISKSNFKTISVITPSHSALEAFDRIVRPCYEKIVHNERESRALAVSRDSLLPMLLSGELRVRGAK